MGPAVQRGKRRACSIGLLMLAAVLCGGAASAGSANTASAARPKPVDINRASVAELKSLPGIGDAEAARIVGARPYRSKAMLVEAGALSDSQFDAVKRHVVALQRPFGLSPSKATAGLRQAQPERSQQKPNGPGPKP